MAAEDDDLELRPADAGTLFRAEMATTNFFLGYWKALVGVVVLILVAVLVYGQYRSFQDTAQRAAAGRIATIEASLEVPIISVAEAVLQGSLTTEKVTKAARDLSEVAKNTSGPARVEADLKAAELFRVAKLDDERRVVLEDALPHADGVLAYSAAGALANLELEQGNGDAAVAGWKALIDRENGFLAEQAMLELGLTLEALDRKDEARQVYADFMAKFSSSPRMEKARQRADRLGSNG